MESSYLFCLVYWQLNYLAILIQGRFMRPGQVTQILVCLSEDLLSPYYMYTLSCCVTGAYQPNAPGDYIQHLTVIRYRLKWPAQTWKTSEYWSYSEVYIWNCKILTSETPVPWSLLSLKEFMIIKIMIYNEETVLFVIHRQHEILWVWVMWHSYWCYLKRLISPKVHPVQIRVIGLIIL